MEEKTRPQTFQLQLDTNSSSPFLVYQLLLIFSTCGSSLSFIPLHRLSSTIPLSSISHTPHTLSVLCYPLHHYAFAFPLSLSRPLFLSPQSHPHLHFFPPSTFFYLPLCRSSPSHSQSISKPTKRTLFVPVWQCKHCCCFVSL